MCPEFFQVKLKPSIGKMSSPNEKGLLCRRTGLLKARLAAAEHQREQVPLPVGSHPHLGSTDPTCLSAQHSLALRLES